VYLVDVYPRAVRRAKSPVAIGGIIVVVLTDLIDKSFSLPNKKSYHIIPPSLAPSPSPSSLPATLVTAAIPLAAIALALFMAIVWRWWWWWW
jgi:hypothetical protein